MVNSVLPHAICLVERRAGPRGENGSIPTVRNRATFVTSASVEETAAEARAAQGHREANDLPQFPPNRVRALLAVARRPRREQHRNAARGSNAGAPLQPPPDTRRARRGAGDELHDALRCGAGWWCKSRRDPCADIAAIFNIVIKIRGMAARCGDRSG